MDVFEAARLRCSALRREIEDLDEMIALGERLCENREGNAGASGDPTAAAIIPLFGRRAGEADS